VFILPIESILTRAEVDAIFRMESGFELALNLLKRPDRPTSIFASNGLMAIGALKAIIQLGLRCPQDVTLASFDDFSLAEVLQPPLTAVAQPAYAIGCKGAELLMQRIESGEKVPAARVGDMNSDLPENLGPI
jgi:LacI family transcriptional regulator